MNNEPKSLKDQITDLQSEQTIYNQNASEEREQILKEIQNLKDLKEKNIEQDNKIRELTSELRRMSNSQHVNTKRYTGVEVLNHQLKGRFLEFTIHEKPKYLITDSNYIKIFKIIFLLLTIVFAVCLIICYPKDLNDTENMNIMFFIPLIILTFKSLIRFLSFKKLMDIKLPFFRSKHLITIEKNGDVNATKFNLYPSLLKIIDLFFRFIFLLMTFSLAFTENSIIAYTIFIASIIYYIINFIALTYFENLTIILYCYNGEILLHETFLNKLFIIKKVDGEIIINGDEKYKNIIDDPTKIYNSVYKES